MKQILCFSFFMLCWCGVSMGQFDYAVSAPYQVVDGEKFYLGEEGSMLAVKRHGKDVILQKFDSKKPALSKTKTYSDLTKGFVIEAVLEFAKSHYCFFSVWDKENVTQQLYYREIDFELGEFKGKDILLFKVNDKLTSPLERYWSFGDLPGGDGFAAAMYGLMTGGAKKFGFALDKKEEKLLVQYRKEPVNKRDAENFMVIGMYVYGEGMEKISGNDIKMPYTEKKMNNLDYTVDADGVPYMLTEVYNDNTTRRKVKNPNGKGFVANYKLELFKINVEAGSIRKTPVEIEDKLITWVCLLEGNDNQIYCSAFYVNGKVFFVDTELTDGICVFKFNKDGGVYDVIHHEIPVEVINKYEKGVTQKINEIKDEKGKAGFLYLDFRWCEVLEDGSVIFVGEQYHTEDRPNNQVAYLYDDMMVAKINPDGKLAWIDKLPKRQEGNSFLVGGMSFSYIHDKENGNHYLLYLDNVKNLDLDLNKVPARHKDGAGGFLTSYKINDATGKVSKENLFDMRDVKGIEVHQFNTDRITHTSNNEFVIEVYKKGKEDVVIRVNVK